VASKAAGEDVNGNGGRQRGRRQFSEVGSELEMEIEKWMRPSLYDSI